MTSDHTGRGPILIAIALALVAGWAAAIAVFLAGG
jgi:hypothetical protein